MPLVDARKRQQNNINLAPTDPILAAHRSPGAPSPALRGTCLW